MSDRKLENCPICSRSIPEGDLERHVNSCLDKQTSPQPIEEVNDTSHDNIDILSSTQRTKKRNAIAALGLQFDSSLKKNKKKESKKVSLTSRLLEERRVQAEIRKKENEIPLEDQFKAVAEEMMATQAEPAQEEEEDVKVPRESDILKRSKAINELKRAASIPLAHRLRPKTLDDFFGQEKLLGKDGALRNMIQSDIIPSFLLWGVPGIGKTSLARIIAKTSSCKFVELSGVNSNAKALKEVFLQAENHKKLAGQRTILFLDEIHRFNKAVQDLLLPVIEKGIVTVIGATTENPSFNLNNALLSRVHTFVMEPLNNESLIKILTRALFEVNRIRKNLYGFHYISLLKDAYHYIANLAMGDSRVALNILETINAYLSADKFKATPSESDTTTTTTTPKQGVIKVTADLLRPLLKTRNFHQMYDRDGDSHYDIISAFHKSVRGSDPNAAMFYLVKMLSGGEDPLFIMRRMIVIASEDIGLRDSSCLPFMVAAKEALEFVGMPEGEIILAHCANKLALAPKSTKSYRALRTAQKIINENPELTKLPVPVHLRNAPTKLMKELGYGDEYKYNPKFENGRIKQGYFPEGMEPLELLEDSHLGAARDPLVSDEEYQQAQAAVDDYQKFKRKHRQKAREEYVEDNEEDVSREPTVADVETEDDKHREYSDNFGKSFDENLERDLQLDYFGDEEV
ncbi:DNA-dependent ATPase MGS1 [Candida viswanathii]|uniref:DNA-dependent ATPase MGS1 n=1 Tax=Candida viswanathii TaxID=5486 RepID=A0A367Y7N3_9ASCO|nr:DNA-dependent ATPase MGS1 [Candida viswanathii]